MTSNSLRSGFSPTRVIDKQARRAPENIGALTTRYDVELTGFSDSSRQRNCYPPMMPAGQFMRKNNANAYTANTASGRPAIGNP